MISISKGLRIPIVALSAISAVTAIWQFYLFVQFRNAAGGFDPQGGTLHLFFAVCAAIVACIAGALVAFSVVNHDQDEVIHITS